MRRLSILSFACVLASCSTDPTSAPSPYALDFPSAQSANSRIDSRAQWYFYGTLSDNVTSTKLYGDNRNLDGTAVANPGVDPSAYDGDAQCGTRGWINWYKSSPPPSGDAFFAPRGGGTTLCQGLARAVTADLSSSVLSIGATLTVEQAMQLSAGQSRISTVMWVWNQTGCARLKYDAAVLGSGVSVTRVSGDANRNAGVWTVESQGTHTAGCYNFTKGNMLTHTGPDYYLPFSARIVEVLR